MALSKIKDNNGNWVTMEGTDAIAADYIVEQGTSGIWTYRKWNSGIAECWNTADIDITIVDANSWAGGFYYHLTSSIYLPNALFNAPPRLQVSPTGAQLTFQVGVQSINAVSASIYLVDSVNDYGMHKYLNITAKGTWK